MGAARAAASSVGYVATGAQQMGGWDWGNALQISAGERMTAGGQGSSARRRKLAGRPETTPPLQDQGPRPRHLSALQIAVPVLVRLCLRRRLYDTQQLPARVLGLPLRCSTRPDQLLPCPGHRLGTVLYNHQAALHKRPRRSRAPQRCSIPQTSPPEGRCPVYHFACT